MQQSFHLFVRQHFSGWYTASVLTHPEYAVFGPAMGPLRDELREVLAQELALGALKPRGETFFDDTERQVLELELRGVQHDRLLRVPMRFTLLLRRLEEADRFEVRIPVIGKRFRIAGRENIEPWSEELIRGHFHLKQVDELLKHQFERAETLERLDVVWHGSGGRRRKRRKTAQQAERERRFSSPLSQVGVELVAEARAGRLRRAHFRDEELRQLLAILAASQNRSLLLLGPSGVGKTALVHELAQRLATREVSERLHGIPLWHITGGRIIAGMKYLGQWQQRCLEVVQELRAERGILFADNLLELLMAGSGDRGLDVGRFLLPHVQKGELTVIAETTPDALLQAEQRNPAFVQALRRLPLAPFSSERSYRILELACGGLEKENRVEFTPQALSRALDILARFGDADALPGSGLTLIEQMAGSPDTAANAARDAQGRRRLGPADAVAAFARSSGFPQALIDPDQLLDVDEVRAFFDRRIIGQPDATELLSDLVMVVKASLNDPGRPIGSFLFMGPTGVGKTESAQTLAQYLFGQRDRLLRFDMSEYGYPGSAARLVGQGLGEGELTRQLREQPFSALLFDEVEKADPEVFDVLLQVLGEGRLTDGTGRTVRFTHAIIILTSNLGARRGPAIGIRGDDERRALALHFQEAARKFFRPELVNRIDFLVPFRELDRAALRGIARIMLDQALAREGFARRRIELSYEPEVLDLLVEQGFDPRYGARPMKRAVENLVLVPLSRFLAGGAEVTGPLRLRVVEGDRVGW